ncbi:phosphodiester glycosidase family protein [Gemmatimonas sp.]|uniref:phosphodiester glycosidase family protein n=1 Tax=Gemmatimonas sp. TaxID=1962908 RepID=UPI00391F9850
MRYGRRWRLAFATTGLVIVTPAAAGERLAGAQSRPGTSVRSAGSPAAAGSTARLETTRIDAIRCPARVAAPASPPALRWRGTTVRWAEWPVRLGAEGVRNRIIVAVVDPARVTLTLEIARAGNALGPWTIEEAPPDAILAFNAGQFTDAGPWGWVRHRGRDRAAPGAGALAGAFAVDTAGRPALLPAHTLPAATLDARWEEAVQSYPQLLVSGLPVPALCAGTDLDRAHRDARLVIGLRRDGMLLVLLSRYADTGSGLTRAVERVPIGPTTPEMAEIAWRLGAIDALMLDGGLSAQLRIGRGAAASRWPGLRDVPLAIVARPR